MFLTRGYAATSLREIAAAVGIQVGSLYNHIDGKHQLLRDMMLAIMDELLAAIEAALDGSTDPVERLEQALDCHIRFHATHSRAVFIGNSELRSLEPEERRQVSGRRRAYEQVLIDLVNDLGDCGRADVIDAKLQVFSIVAIGTHVASWYRPGAGLALDDVVAVYTEATMRQLNIRPDHDALVGAVPGTVEVPE
ncbi:TetR/AcrR family transcriptional regulator [Nocardioides aromaticivorans]|uniref:TetR/AcrR family transcriptional regulator n=1 Tax=Nocardioides aromaticivorans TaxID=200618 RepID=UPI003BF48842